MAASTSGKLHATGQPPQQTQRAERAQSLLGDEEAEDARGPDADQELNRLINLAARRTADLPPPEPCPGGEQ